MSFLNTAALFFAENRNRRRVFKHAKRYRRFYREKYCL